MIKYSGDTMSLDQKGAVSFHIIRGIGKKWQVTEEEFEKTLVCFVKLEDAKDYANEMASIKKGPQRFNGR
jgi:hypothetical protein